MKITILFFCLVLAQTAFGANLDASTQSDCGNQASSAQALKDYKESRFADAIKHAQAKAPCQWQDWQLIFNSYMALSLQHPSEDAKQAALSKVAEFQRRPTWFADPGPLLVVLGDDKAASEWYIKSTYRLKSEKGNSKREIKILRSRKLYFDAARKLLDSANWPTLRIDEKLTRLAEAEMESVEQAKKH